MRTTVLTIALMVMVFINVNAMPGQDVYRDIPIITDNGGPDAYGYRWIDSDGSGGPAFNWIDITAIGERVVGLMDDNAVGPFNMGFQFPYYWYEVNKMWIGSNGYISFSSNANFWHPFTNLPDAANPNDVVAVLGGDLDFTRPGAECYYWSNNRDTFIVSWLNVPQFSPEHNQDDSTHTFQLILSAVDSSLTFQYGENHGNFTENGNLADVIGMENGNGQVGLQYLRNNIPGNRLWHQGLVIRFHPEPNPDYIVHDVGILSGMNEASEAEFRSPNQQYVIRAQVKNYGNQSESNVKARVEVRRGTIIVVTDTVEIALQPQETRWVEFPRNFTPTILGVYRLMLNTIMIGDMVSINNSMTTELNIYQLPQFLRYSDDTWDDEKAITADHGYGASFILPEPIEIGSLGFYVASIVSEGDATIRFFHDDGNSAPDISYPPYEAVTPITATDWNTVDLSGAGLQFLPNRTFYVSILGQPGTEFNLAFDESVPMSRRSWDFGELTRRDIDRETLDPRIRLFAEQWIPDTCTFIAGDGNDDGVFNNTDISFLVNYLKSVGPAPSTGCQCIYQANLYAAADINGDCSFNGVDVVYGVNYLKYQLLPPQSCQECPYSQ